MLNTVSNGTILGRWSLSRSIPMVAIALILFFVLIEPEASRGLSFWPRMLFWTIHVATGLVGLLFAMTASLTLMPRLFAEWRPVIAIGVSGLIGALITAPVFFAMEQILPVPLTAIEDSPIDRFGEQGLWQALLVEFIEVTPIVVIAWFIINMPLLLNEPELDEEDTSGDIPEPMADVEEAHRKHEQFLARLPETVGTDIYAVSSDLHYLHVYTAAGKCMIHGSMRGAVDALGDLGLQVHRSHWVARHAVDKLVRNNGQSLCVLVNGLRIPVSRRNRRVVQEWLGQQARTTPLDNVRTLERKQ